MKGKEKTFTGRGDNRRFNDDKRVFWRPGVVDNEVKVIDSDDKFVGVMLTSEALRMAKERGLDLVEVSSGVTPPICKILDYGKYKYDVKKDNNLKRKKQKSLTLKEIQLRQCIGAADLETKLKKVRQFIAEEDKVKVVVRLRGREMINKNLAINLLNKITSELGASVKLEKEITQNNNNFFVIFTPNACNKQ